METASSEGETNVSASDNFQTSPLIRWTLLLLYLALTGPLPILAGVTTAPISPLLLLSGMMLGGVILYGVLQERVTVDAQGMRVHYPVWIPQFFRAGWYLSWQQVQALKPRITGQGGRVYYLLSTSGEAYLLPMRVAGFSRLAQFVQAKTGIDTTTVKPLAQIWMYLILLAFSLMLLVIDIGVVWSALSSG
ncbi:MAG: hypothetical protein F6K19_34670 [Cyanothece sp. SIO1E1]|nr:hypothetical protein [Cyanothece sp. SIO1E1]